MAKSVKTNPADRQPAKKKVPQLPMNWFKFIIYVQLFITAFSEVMNAFTYLTGRFYSVQGIDPAAFYSQYGAFRIVDYAFGLAGIAFALFAIYTRFQLAGFKKGAPQLFLKYTLYSVAKTGIYVLLFVVVFLFYGVKPEIAELVDYISLMIGGTVLYFVNKSYFEKRNFMFNR